MVACSVTLDANGEKKKNCFGSSNVCMCVYYAEILILKFLNFWFLKSLLKVKISEGLLKNFLNLTINFIGYKARFTD